MILVHADHLFDSIQVTTEQGALVCGDDLLRDDLTGLGIFVDEQWAHFVRPGIILKPPDKVL